MIFLGLGPHPVILPGSVLFSAFVIIIPFCFKIILIHHGSPSAGTGRGRDGFVRQPNQHIPVSCHALLGNLFVSFGSPYCFWQEGWGKESLAAPIERGREQERANTRLSVAGCKKKRENSSLNATGWYLQSFFSSGHQRYQTPNGTSGECKCFLKNHQLKISILALWELTVYRWHQRVNQSIN